MEPQKLILPGICSYIALFRQLKAGDKKNCVILQQFHYPSIQTSSCSTTENITYCNFRKFFTQGFDLRIRGRHRSEIRFHFLCYLILMYAIAKFTRFRL